MLQVIGLGSGGADTLPVPNRSLLVSGLPVFLRTAKHPTIAAFPELFARSVSFDDEYERGLTFDAVYDAIVERLLATHSAHENIVYAVPGHPLVGETTVARLLARAKSESIPIRILGAPSFVDACLEALQIALTENFVLVDALALNSESPVAPPVLRGASPILLYQVHDRAAASNAKLSLMRAGYPDDFTITVLRAAGIADLEERYETPLYALDRTESHDHLTTVWIPTLPAELRRPSYDELVSILARLRRRPDGCPWDLEQTHQTLRRYLLEETYEVAEAIDGDDPDLLCEELGDLLLQVVFHAQIASEEGIFDQADVCASIAEKLIRRHPHIFGDTVAETAEEVLKNWQIIKSQEKGKAAKAASILDGLSTSLPALLLAHETSRRVVKVGFEWADIDGVLDKVEEEFAELRAEIEAGGQLNNGRIEGELGDLLFTLVNVARRLNIDPEIALRRQVSRFGRRFRHIEGGARAQDRALESLSLAEMEALWQEAKTLEASGQEVKQ